MNVGAIRRVARTIIGGGSARYSDHECGNSRLLPNQGGTTENPFVPEMDGGVFA